MTNDLVALKKRLATSATGFAAIIDGVLVIGAAAETRNGAAVNALYRLGYNIVTGCTDPDCDCYCKVLAHFRTDVQIAPVKIEVAV